MTRRFGRQLAGLITLTSSLCAVPAEAQQWRLSTPSWRVGNSDGGVQLFNVAGASLLSNGDLAIANAGSREIVMLARDGKLRWRHGRKGQAPGEYESIEGITTWNSDSVAVIDGTLRRVTVLTGNGELVRTFFLPRLPPGSSVTGLHAIRSGRFLVGTQRGRMPGDPAGIMRTRGALIEVGGDGELLSIVAEFQGDEWFAGSDHRVLGMMPYGRVTRYAARGSRILIAEGVGSVREITLPATAERPINVPALRVRRISDKHIRDYKANTLRGASDEFRSALARHLEEISFHQEFPATRDLVLSQEGEAWIEEYPVPGATGTRWHVLSSNGTAMATLAVPRSYRILTIGRNVVYVLDTNDVGVETIMRIPIHRAQ